MSQVFQLILKLINVLHNHENKLQLVKPKQRIRKKGFPLAWIYLKMFGQITESLCNEFIWTFSKEDFKNALSCFVFDCTDDSQTINDIVDNIKIRFNKFLQAEFRGTIKEWVEQMFLKVIQF